MTTPTLRKRLTEIVDEYADAVQTQARCLVRDLRAALAESAPDAETERDLAGAIRDICHEPCEHNNYHGEFDGRDCCSPCLRDRLIAAGWASPTEVTAPVDAERAKEAGEIAKWVQREWRLFREHRPVGAYLPVGQLDGDCRCGRGEWPCETLTQALAARAATKAVG